jgi:hypothetical protein
VPREGRGVQRKNGIDFRTWHTRRRQRSVRALEEILQSFISLTAKSGQKLPEGVVISSALQQDAGQILPMSFRIVKHVFN